MTPPANIRSRFVEWVSMLADAGAQAKYEKDVPFVPVHVELVETFYDLYVPADRSFEAAFTPEEAESLADLERVLDAAAKRSQSVDVHSVAQLHELPEWQLVITQAQRVREFLEPKG